MTEYSFFLFRCIKKSAALSLVICLFLHGLILLPYWTASSEGGGGGASILPQCRIDYKTWMCSDNYKRSPAIDAGAVNWVEIPSTLLHHQTGAFQPKWNFWSGSGYPSYLDGHNRLAAPSRIWLSTMGSSWARDAWIFLRYFLWTFCAVCIFLLSGEKSIGFAALFGCCIALTPYISLYVDHVFLDVDMLATGLFALFAIASNMEQMKPIFLFLAFSFGAYAGIQGFAQSLGTFAIVASLQIIIFTFFYGKKFFKLGFFFLMGFTITAAPYLLQAILNLPEFTSSRDAQQCLAAEYYPFWFVWETSYKIYSGHLKEPLALAFSAPGLFFLGYGFIQEKKMRPFLLLWLALVAILLFGFSPFCSLPGISGIRFHRHLSPYIQSMFLILGFWSISILGQKKQWKTPWLYLIAVIFFVPFSHKGALNLKVIRSEYAPRLASEFQLPPEGSLFEKLRNLSQNEDRRHFSPDQILFPNWSSVLQVQDLRILEALYQKNYFYLNSQLFKQWKGDPTHVIKPDRFTELEDRSLTFSEDFQRVLAINHVSLFSFTKDSFHLFPEEGPYKKTSMEKIGSNDSLEVWKAKDLPGVGFFPEKVIMAPEKASDLLKTIQQTSPSEIMKSLWIQASDSAHKNGIQASQGSIESISRLPDRLIYHLNIKSEGYFGITQTWFPGWKAEWLNQSIPIERANINFMTVYLKKGQGVLILNFQPSF